MRGIIKIFVTTLLLMFTITICSATETTTNFYIIKLHSEIDKSASRLISDALKEAETKRADYIILDINTYGGAVDAADSIRTVIMQYPKPVIAFINNQAVSAGALISIACDSIYMREGSSFGAATVVNQNGEVLPDKYQSFMRAMMRSTAESSGRDPLIAQSMVSKDSVLSFTPTEAMANNYCEGLAENINDIIPQILQDTSANYTITEHKISGVKRITYFFLNPFIQGLLLMLIIGGIYFELQSPGIGFPLIAALAGIVLYFVPLYIEGFVENWEIILFFLGIGLLFVEVFVLPGFGIAGVSGIILVIVTLAFAMIDNDIVLDGGNFNIQPLIKPFTIVLVSTTSMLFISIWLAAKLYGTKSFSHIALKTNLSANDGGFVGVESENFNKYIGRECVVATDLKPQGYIEIDGKRLPAQLDFGFAGKGEILKIFSHHGGRLYCKKEIK